MSRPLVSVVVPCLNEEDNVRPLYERLRATLVAAEVDYEVIFSLDPCTDATEDRIREIRLLDPAVKMLRLSRRFGQPAATLAGIRMASGDAVVVIDCDLQDPPELIGDMIGALVAGLRRRLRAAALARRRDAAQADRGGARLPGHPARGRGRDPAQHGRLPPHEPARRRRAAAPQRDPRLPARARRPWWASPRRACSTTATRGRRGDGKYNRFTGSVRIGLNGIIGFSRYPLQIITWIGLITFTFAMLLALVYLCLRLAGIEIVWGNPTLVIIVSFFSGIQLLSLGVIGEYVGRIYDEVKRRPLFVVDALEGFERPMAELEETPAPARERSST